MIAELREEQDGENAEVASEALAILAALLLEAQAQGARVA